MDDEAGVAPSPGKPAADVEDQPIAVVLDVHYLGSAYAVAADVTVDKFEAALSKRCGGGRIVSRHACDALASDAVCAPDVAEQRKELHAKLRNAGYTVALAPPRPSSGVVGNTDVDVACAILAGTAAATAGASRSYGASRAPRKSAGVLALVAGDADFSAALSHVLSPAAELAVPLRRAFVFSGRAPSREPGGHIVGAAAASGASSHDSISHADALPLLPSLMPTMVTNDVREWRDRRRRRVIEEEARAVKKEDELLVKRYAMERAKTAKKKARTADEQAKRDAKAQEAEEKRLKKEAELQVCKAQSATPQPPSAFTPPPPLLCSTPAGEEAQPEAQRGADRGAARQVARRRGQARLLCWCAG